MKWTKWTELGTEKKILDDVTVLLKHIAEDPKPRIHIYDYGNKRVSNNRIGQLCKSAKTVFEPNPRQSQIIWVNSSQIREIRIVVTINPAIRLIFV